MLFEELIQRYNLEKNQPPQHANELLDYIQKSYIQREITISDYKRLYCELNKRNAEKPQFYEIKINQSYFEKINRPS